MKNFPAQSAIGVVRIGRKFFNGFFTSFSLRFETRSHTGFHVRSHTGFHPGDFGHLQGLLSVSIPGREGRRWFLLGNLGEQPPNLPHSRQVLIMT